MSFQLNISFMKFYLTPFFDVNNKDVKRKQNKRDTKGFFGYAVKKYEQCRSAVERRSRGASTSVLAAFSAESNTKAENEEKS
ncbi:hypothetical protein V6N13_063083 [Hibiscus sabdariffa]